MTPIHVLMELTYRCNVRCVHCYLAGREDEMTLPEIERLLDQMAAAGTLVLTLSGGEVLLRRDFFDIAGAARERAFALRIFTNGTLVDDRAADQIAALRPVVVEMSLLGATAATHDAITLKRGSFVRTIAGARRLIGRGVRVKLKTTLMQSNVDEAPAIEELAGGIGATTQISHVMMPRRGGDLTPLSYQIDDRALRRFVERRRRDIFDQAEPMSDGDNLCSAARATCSVSPSGDVFPCVLMPARAGNVRETDFGTIWRESATMRHMRALAAAHPLACGGCDGGDSYCPAYDLLRQSAVPAQPRAEE